ncbi:MAG TPA: long-chain fatty acid--CoA ligase [Stellaceae bacterium]|nr:long-chain fatty acid--CoA ligase [Stellaceae bacterium]
MTDRPWLKSYPPGIVWDADFPAHPVTKLLDDAVERFGDRPCLDFLGNVSTYRMVGDLVRRAAKGFAALGVRPGVRVGLMLPNTPYYVIAYFGVLRAGGTVVNINPLYVEREIRQLLGDAGCGIVVTLDLKLTYDVLERLRDGNPLKTLVVCPMADILPFAKGMLYRALRRRDQAEVAADEAHVAFAALTDNDGRLDPPAVDPIRDVAVLQYTGGTTGTPKGAMLSHANLVANVLQCMAWFPEFRPGEERTLAVLPFFHVFAMTVVMNLSLAAGAEIILLPRFDLKELLKTIHHRRPTSFPGVPTLFTAINNAKHLDRYDLTSIRSCISGGAPLPVEVKAQFEGLTGCTLVEGYGLSETAPVVACNPLKGVNKPGAVGPPMPGTVIDIVSVDDPSRVLGPGERGEVRVRGPQVMLGYWAHPEATADVLRGGALRTGDVGYLDEDGYLFLVDRIKDVVIAGGYKIYPRLVEEAIFQHPRVRECIVIGVPDPYRGQTVKAFVVLREGEALTAEDLTEFLKQRLSPIEMPKLIEFRDSLPKTLIGKPSKRALEQEEAARARGEKAPS